MNLEWRVSSSYISEYESQDSTFYSRFEDLRSLSTSIRYYQGKDCTGFFTGIGFTIAQLTANDLSYFFGFLKSEDRADFQIKGIIFETGITTIINGPLFLSWWGAFVAADADYECLNREKTGQKFLLLPSAKLSIGYLF